jgi:phosphatidylglycerophosphatase A
MKNKNIATILFIIVIIISIKIYSLDILSLFSKNYDTVKIKADEIVSKSDFIKIIKIEQKLSHF